jgi:Photosynthesis system II assembly factor YCF48
MDRIAKLVSGRLKAKPAPGSHPGPELLAAFAENALPHADRGQLLQHLGDCSDCREILYLALPPSPASQKVLVLQPRPFRRWALGFGALFASVAMVAIVFTTNRLGQKNQAAPMVATAPVGGNAANTKIAAEKTPRELDQLQTLRDENKTKVVTSLVRPEAKPRPDAKHMTAKLQPELVFEDSGEVHVQVPATSANAVGASVSTDTDKDKNGRQKQNPGVAVLNGAVTQTGSAGKLGNFGYSKTEPSKSRVDQQAAAGQQVAVQADAVSPPGSASTSNLKVPASSEVVEVEAAAPAVESNSFSRSANAAVVARKSAIALPKWSLTAAGEIQRSLDHGKTWVSAQPASRVVFRAIASVGAEVWAAGNGGALYHSADSGLTWTRLTVKAGGKDLQDDLSAIEFTDAVHGHVRTVAGTDFITSDGGQNWQRK